MGIVNRRMGIQDIPYVRIRKWIETQRLDVGVRRNGLQVLAVMVAKPIGVAARDSKARPAQPVKTPSDLLRRVSSRSMNRPELRRGRQ